MVADVAGPIAESIATGKRTRTSFTDAENVRRALAGYPASERNSVRRFARDAARRWLLENWDIVAAVADELARVGSMTGQELDWAISAATDGRFMRAA
jgi:RNase P protein component